MKNFLLLLLIGCSTIVWSQDKKDSFDPILAKELGADDYGMKKYILVILKTGNADLKDKEKINSLFRGHMENIEKMAAEGKLVIAGPFFKNEKNYRGIYIFNLSDFSEAEKLLQSDPAIASGLLASECYEWYGSAALKTYLPIHEKIAKSKP